MDQVGTKGRHLRVRKRAPHRLYLNSFVLKGLDVITENIWICSLRLNPIVSSDLNPDVKGLDLFFARWLYTHTCFDYGPGLVCA
jgi:hypothetical protein